MTSGMAIEILLSALLVMTVSYCFILDRKITKISHLEQNREQLIEQLTALIAQAAILQANLTATVDDATKTERASRLKIIASPAMNEGFDGLIARAKQFREKQAA